MLEALSDVSEVVVVIVGDDDGGTGGVVGMFEAALRTGR